MLKHHGLIRSEGQQKQICRKMKCTVPYHPSYEPYLDDW